MDWEAMTESELWDEINAACKRMSVQQTRLWEAIRIDPEKWKQHPYGDQGGGFWAIAVLGRTVVWYNDIEGGFNTSNYWKWGEIDQYRCNQDQLEWTVQHLLNEINDGNPKGGHFGPPQPVR